MLNNSPLSIYREGELLCNVAANIQGKMIFLNNSKIDINEGDTIERVYNDGRVDKYVVLDRGFCLGSELFGNHYQMKVEKLDSWN